MVYPFHHNELECLYKTLKYMSIMSENKLSIPWIHGEGVRPIA